MDRKLAELKYREGIASRCIQGVHYFEHCTGHDGFFWPFIQNAVGETVCLSWSHLFGNRTDDLHFSRFFGRSDVSACGEEFTPDAVKSRLLECVSLSEVEYEEFWKEVKTCRDKFIAHKELGEQEIYFPRIDLCRVMSEELRLIFSECIENWRNESDSLDLKGMSEYYRLYPNRVFAGHCHNQFRYGIETVHLNMS